MIPCIFSADNGRRLEPLTCSCPVPLLEICGKPVIEYTIDMLRKNGFSEAVVSVIHKKEAVEEYFQNTPHNNFSVSFDIPAIPENEPVLLINADSLYSINLENAVKFHSISNSVLTVITHTVNDCRTQRAIFTDKNRKIISSLDNPTYMDCLSAADTGIYIISPRIFGLVRNSGSISAEFINHLISENLDVYGYECTGYCRSIDTAESYMKCQQDILCNSVNADIYGHRTLDGNIIHGTYSAKDADISGIISIGSNVFVQSGTVIDGLSVIGNDVKIGKNSTLHSCIIMDGAYIGDSVVCSEAIICRNATLLGSSSADENCIIGENAVIGENTAVKADTRIWNGKNTGNGKIISYDLKYGHSFELEIDENGICGETNAVITPHTALSAGTSFGMKNRTYIIGYGEGNASYTIAHAFADGILSAGGNVWFLGECIQCETDYTIKKLNADGGAYINSGNITRIIPFSKNGMLLNDTEKSALEYAVNHENSGYAPYTDYGSTENISVYRRIYFKYLNDILPEKINFDVSVNSSDKNITKLCQKLFKNKKMKNDTINSLVFNISSDGRKISAYSESSGFIFHEKLLLLCCDDILSNGHDMTVPVGASSMIYRLAEKYGRKITAYSGKSEYPPFFTDGLVLMCETIRILSQKHISLSDAVENLPDYASSSKFISIEHSPADILKKLYSRSVISSDGAVISDIEGNASIKPSRSGKSITVYAESSKYEFAKELCDFISENINEADI